MLRTQQRRTRRLPGRPRHFEPPLPIEAVAGPIPSCDRVTRAQAEFQARLLDAVQQAVIAVAFDGTITYLNRFAVTLFGWSLAEIQGHSLCALLSPAGTGDAAPSTLHTGQNWQGELQFRRRDGTTFPGRVNDAPLLDEFGRLAGMVRVVEDLTEYQAMQVKIQEAAHHTLDILENISDAFFSLDEQLVVTYFNPAAERELKHPRNEVLGRYLFDIFPEAAGSTFEQKYRQALLEKRLITFEVYFPIPPYENWYDVRVYPQRNGIAVYFQITTERRRAQEALRRAEEQYRSLFENAPLGMFRATPTGEFQIVNPTLAQILGYPSPGALLAGADPGSPPAPTRPSLVSFAVDPQQQADWLTTVRECTDTLRIETRYRRRDGRIIYANLIIRCILDSEGRFEALEGTIEDITEHREMQEALHAAHETLRAIIEAAPLAVIAFDAGGRVKLWNPAAEQLFKMERTAALDQTFPCLEASGNRNHHNPLIRTFYQIVQKGHTLTGIETNHYLPDGTGLFLSASAAPLWNAEGKNTGLVALIEDISERKQTENELEESRRRLQGIFDNDLDAILLLDDQARLIEVNPATGPLTGYSRSELLEMALFDLIPPELQESMHAIWAAFLTAGETTGEYRLRRQDGTQALVEYRAVARILPHLHLVVLNDITARKQAEEALARQARELARSNADLEQFAYIASHDLQEPLRMVSNYVQLLDRRYKDRLDDDAREFITQAVDGARRMQKMIQDLLAYSRVQTRGSPFVLTDMEKVLDQTLTNLSLAIEENTATLTHTSLPQLYVDPGQLQQLFQNLIGNAIKFRSALPPQIHISAERRETGWYFAVRDNGIGIPSQQASRLFNLFQRLHSREEYPGSGIGLAICKKIVERHGGTIGVESAPGQGTTFFFTLPAEQPEQAN